MPRSESSCRRLVAIAALLLLGACSPGVEVSAPFEARPVTLETYGLFDLGVTDADADGRPDVFTSTYSGPQSLALNRGELRFQNVFTEWGLDQDPAFPGLAVLPAEPTPGGPGLYIGWHGPELVVRAHGLDAHAEPVAGTIELYSAVVLGKRSGFDVAVNSINIAPRVDRSVLSFSGSGDGYFTFRPAQHSVPIAIRVNSGAAASEIRVGPRQVAPAASEFTLLMRDRHGMAWADYDGDGAMDLFITRGGIQGTMKYIPLPFWDELFVARDAGMEEIGRAVGLAKRGCPGRAAAWVDYDRDGRLDLYVVCGRDAGGEEFPNQLFRQESDGNFADVAANVGLDLPGEGKFIWSDDDGDGDTDFLWVDRSGISRYENLNGRFVPHGIEAFARPVKASGLRIGDANGDGLDDVFVVATENSRLLMRVETGFTVLDPASIGLPPANLAAGFVDVDNDGIEEFYSVPHGLYRRGSDGIFAATGELAWRASALAYQQLIDAHVAWADFDGDGTRDLLLSVNRATKKGSHWASWFAKLAGDETASVGPLRGHWATEVLSNPPSENHWLQVDLVGPPGNRQAVGARVTLGTAGGERIHAVGHAESSTYSQGHYRVYFGLGTESEPDRITIDWPDGHRQTIERPGCDRRITIDWNGARPG